MEKKNEKKEVKKVESVETRTKLEKIQTVVIVILSLVIVFGLAYFVPELKNCGTCKVEEKELTSITMEDYRTLLNGEQVSLVYLAQPGCGYCQQQEPIMKEFVNEYDFEVNYLDTSKMDNKEADEVYNLYKTVQEERYEVDGVRTPTILVVQKGKLLDMNLGNMALDELVAMLQKYTKIGE